MSQGNGVVWGFVGLGSQGAPMARRMIDAGLDTVLWARRPETLDAYRQTAARFAHTLTELGQEVDCLCICVVSDEDVRQVCDAVIPVMRPGSLIIIHSTVHPDTCKAIGNAAAEKGLRVIDAPVSGGGPAAEAAALTVMAGGNPADLDDARPALESFGKLIVHLGPLGAGQNAKLINNTLFAANLGMAHAALAAAEELGISREALAGLIRESSGRSYGFDVRARMPPPAKFKHPAQLLAKDVNLLGQAIGEQSPAFAPLRDAADGFISFVLNADEV
jgi:3-hydroxyisobutyrate dehydrogenase-like beta-hydroxyacid dehydrogenase